MFGHSFIQNVLLSEVTLQYFYHYDDDTDHAACDNYLILVESDNVSRQGCSDKSLGCVRIVKEPDFQWNQSIGAKINILN